MIARRGLAWWEHGPEARAPINLPSTRQHSNTTPILSSIFTPHVGPRSTVITTAIAVAVAVDGVMDDLDLPLRMLFGA